MSRDRLSRPDLPAENAEPRAAEAPRPRIGVWGRFDSAGFLDLVQPGILELEFRRRLPEAELRVSAPTTTASGAGFATAELGAWSSRRAAELSESLDCVIVAGELFGASDERPASAGRSGPRLDPFLIEGLGSKLEAACPLVWSGVSVAFDLEPGEAERLRTALGGRSYLSVRDEASRARLRRAGVDADVALIPDPLLLLPRAFPEEVLARRLEYLRHMEWFPRSGQPVVIQESAAFDDRAEELAATVAAALERSPVAVVVLGLGPGDGDGRFADALSRHASLATFRIPAGSSVADSVAVLAHARAFVGSSARAAVACSAFGVPALVVERSSGESSRELVLAIRRLLPMPAGTGAEPADLAALDAHFDRLADLAEKALVKRLRRDGVSEERLLARLRENERVLDSWRAAHAARSQQVVDSRLRLAELAERGQKLAAELRELQDEAARRHHAWSAVTEELKVERGERDAVSRGLANERQISARAISERDDLSREAAKLRTRQAELEGDLAESRAHATRAADEVLSLRAEVDRVHERLEKARADHAEVRTSHNLMFTEIAEARADAGRFAEIVADLQAQLERLQRLQSPAAGPERK